MEKHTNILVECPELIASVRVGVLEPLKPFIENGKCKVVFKRTVDIRRRDIAWCDILICVRGSEQATLNIIEAAKKAGRFVIYFLDDDLLHIPDDISCSAYFSNLEIKNCIIKCIEYSDVSWCVNNLIAEKYSIYSKKKWVVSKVPVTMENVYFPKGMINIIYAGSVDHTETVRKYIAPVVKKLHDEFMDVATFTFIGVNPKLEELKNVTYIKYFEEYDEYKKFTKNGKFSIGLAPLNIGEFYKCKYYNKFIEYTSVGAVGVYSNSEPYTLIIEDGKNGFLCDNTFESWYGKLKYLILHQEVLENVFECAKNNIKNEFSYEEVASKLEADIKELTMYKAPAISYRKLDLINSRYTFYFNRIKQIWESYKFGIVIVLPYKVCKKVFKFVCGGKNY